MRIGNDVHQTANPFIGNGTCLCVLFWKLSLHTSDCALVISRWLDAAHNRPPNAPAAPVLLTQCLTSSPYPEIAHPAADAHSSSSQPARAPPYRNGKDRNRWVLHLTFCFFLIWDYSGFAGWRMLRGCGDTHGTKGCRGLMRGSGQTPFQVNKIKFYDWSSIFLVSLSADKNHFLCGFCLILNWCWSIRVCWVFSMPYQWRIFFGFSVKQEDLRKCVHLDTRNGFFFLYLHTAELCWCPPDAPAP